MIRRASFFLLRFQESGFERIGENKALLTLFKADGHISPIQFNHLADAELSVSHSAPNGSAGNNDLQFFRLLGLGRNDWRFDKESGSDKIRLFGYFLSGTMPCASHALIPPWCRLSNNI